MIEGEVIQAFSRDVVEASRLANAVMVRMFDDIEAHARKIGGADAEVREFGYRFMAARLAVEAFQLEIEIALATDGVVTDLMRRCCVDFAERMQVSLSVDLNLALGDEAKRARTAALAALTSAIQHANGARALN